VKVSWARSRVKWKQGARDGQHGVGQQSTRGIKARCAWAHGLVRGKRTRGSEGRARGSDGCTPWLSQRPAAWSGWWTYGWVCICIYIYIYIARRWYITYVYIYRHTRWLYFEYTLTQCRCYTYPCVLVGCYVHRQQQGKSWAPISVCNPRAISP
jgi:hypothetical protein